MPEPDVASITLHHHFAAPLDAVWRAWTDASVVSRWWGSDPAGRVVAADLDVQPGGAFSISFVDSSGDRHTSFGRYLTVTEPTSLVFSWSWIGEHNEPSRVTVDLASDSAGTQMQFTHDTLTGVSAHDYAEGWTRTFAKLNGVLAQG